MSDPIEAVFERSSALATTWEEWTFWGATLRHILKEGSQDGWGRTFLWTGSLSLMSR